MQAAPGSLAIGEDLLSVCLRGAEGSALLVLAKGSALFRASCTGKRYLADRRGSQQGFDSEPAVWVPSCISGLRVQKKLTHALREQ